MISARCSICGEFFPIIGFNELNEDCVCPSCDEEHLRMIEEA